MRSQKERKRARKTALDRWKAPSANRPVGENQNEKPEISSPLNGFPQNHCWGGVA